MTDKYKEFESHYAAMEEAHSAPPIRASSDRKHFVLGPITEKAVRETVFYTSLTDAAKTNFDQQFLSGLKEKDRIILQLDEGKNAVRAYKGRVSAGALWEKAGKEELVSPEIYITQTLNMKDVADGKGFKEETSLKVILERADFSIDTKSVDKLIGESGSKNFAQTSPKLDANMQRALAAAKAADDFVGSSAPLQLAAAGIKTRQR